MSSEPKHPPAALAILASAQAAYERSAQMFRESMPAPVQIPPWHEADNAVLLACIDAAVSPVRALLVLTASLQDEQRDKILENMTAVLDRKVKP